MNDTPLLTAPLVVRRWLDSRLLTEAAFTLMAAAGCFLMGFVILAATFYICYALILSPVGRTPDLIQSAYTGVQLLDHATVFVLAAAITVLLFAAFFLKDKTDRQFANPSSPAARCAHALSTACFALLFASPQLFALSYEFARRAYKLLTLDSDLSARILALLVSHQGRVSFTAIAAALNLQNPVPAFRQVTLIDGVVFLASDPCGLSLTADLRTEIAAAIPPANSSFRLPEYLACPACSFACRVEGAAPHDTFSCPGCGSSYQLRLDSHGRLFFDPVPAADVLSDDDDQFAWSCSVLGLPADATMQQAKAAYRKLIKDNHPDRVFGLGPELEQLAAEKSKQLNKAYDLFVARFS